MKPRSHSVRLRVESLGDRLAPANLTAAFAGGTLTVVGDDGDNDVTVQGDAADHTHFTLSSTGTINNAPAPYSSPSGVTNIVVRMLAGTDRVTFGNAAPIDLAGSLSVDGGNGATYVTSTDMRVGKNLMIANGSTSAGSHQTFLANLSVGGNLTVKNGDGDSLTEIWRNVAGVSTVRGNLSVTNGAGEDRTYLIDTNVDGNVKVNNGHGSAAGLAGSFDVFDQNDTSSRLVIGGNLSVTYLDGNASGIHPYDGIWDTEVMGAVTLRHGPGTFETRIDNYVTAVPVAVHGSLTIAGSGTNAVNVGTNTYYGHGAGLVVDKRLTITSGGGSDTLSLNRVQVGGDARLGLGDGTNTVSIDDCQFRGRFGLTTGAGADTFTLEGTAGSDSATEFKKAVTIALGAGSNAGNVAFNHADARQAVVAWGTFVVTGAETWNQDVTQELFPNGGHIQL